MRHKFFERKSIGIPLHKLHARGISREGMIGHADEADILGTEVAVRAERHLPGLGEIPRLKVNAAFARHVQSLGHDLGDSGALDNDVGAASVR